MNSLFFGLMLIFTASDDSTVIQIANRNPYVFLDTQTVFTKYPFMRNSLDSIRTYPNMHESAAIQLCPIKWWPFIFPKKYKLEIDTSGHAFLALFNSRDGQLSFLDLGRLEQKARLYIYPDEILYDKHLPGFCQFLQFYLFVDARIYERFGVANIHNSTRIDIPHKEFLNEDGANEYFTKLDEITSVNDTVVSGPFESYPDCILLNISDKADSSSAPYDWCFDIEADSEMVSLLLLSKRKRLVRLFFNTRLTRGRYALYFAKIRPDAEPLWDADYYFLMREGIQKKYIKVVLKH